MFHLDKRPDPAGRLAVDVPVLLQGLGLGQYEAAFREAAITADELPSLTEEHLRDLGLPLGHRLKLLKAITALGEVATERKPVVHRPVSDAPGAEGERRQVAVLFADLAGFTELSNRLDAEVVHDLLGLFFECIDQIVVSYGGHVDKHIGDCVMAVFGAPVAHGNDAERAVGAALAIRDAMRGVSENSGQPVDVHVGIAGGQVLAGALGSDRHSEFTVTGETVNLASRLTDAAAAGQIVVSQTIRRAIGKRFDGLEMETLVVKGFAEPIRAWRLLGLLTVTADAATPFVGRRNELYQLTAALAGCRDHGHGQIVRIRGEAGIGKSRLLDEVRRRAHDAGFRVHGAQLLDFGGGSGLNALRTLVCSLLCRETESGSESSEEDVKSAVERGLVAAQDAIFVADLLGQPQPLELRPLYEAMDNSARVEGRRRTLGRLVRRASGISPRLLLVEDLHWADGLTLDRLADIAAAVPACAALLVMTTRVEGDPLDSEWRSRVGGESFTTVELGPLGHEDALALAGSLFDAAGLLAEQFVDRAGGNPLFLEQLLQHARETAGDGVPGSVLNLVQARLDRLDPADKVALQAASVLGQHFKQDSLSNLLGRSEYDPKRLVARSLIRARGDAFQFTHALIRDAVYDTLLKSRRRELHAKAARWFAGRDPVTQAEHLERAESSEAPQAYLAAARCEAAEYRYDMAQRLAERGLDIAKTTADRSALECFRGEVLHDLGNMELAQSAYEAALAAAGDGVARCRAWIGLAAVKRVTGDVGGALAALQSSETEAEAHDLAAEQARIHYMRGNLCFPSGDWEGCLREHGAALEHARRANMVELEATALGGLGDAEYMRGRMISAHTRFSDCVATSVRHGIGRIEAANRPMMAFTRMFAGDVRDALNLAEEAIGVAARVGHLRGKMIAHHAAWWCRHALTDFAAAREDAEAALSLSRQLGAHRFDAEALAMRAELHRIAGRVGQAIADAAEAVEICRGTGPTFLGPIVLGLQARIIENQAARHAALDEADALIQVGAVSHNELLFRRDAIEICLEDGDWDRAERYAAALETYTRAEPLPWSAFYVDRGRALAAAGRGECTAGLERLLEQGERLGLRISLPKIEAALTVQAPIHRADGDSDTGEPK
jgi:class 3 adenylate cyclase/tetratricopeptide (TPR) repeat protein